MGSTIQIGPTTQTGLMTQMGPTTWMASMIQTGLFVDPNGPDNPDRSYDQNGPDNSDEADYPDKTNNLKGLKIQTDPTTRTGLTIHMGSMI